MELPVLQPGRRPASSCPGQQHQVWSLASWSSRRYFAMLLVPCNTGRTACHIARQCHAACEESAKPGNNLQLHATPTLCANSPRALSCRRHSYRRLPGEEAHGRQLSGERTVAAVLVGLTSLHVEVADLVLSPEPPPRAQVRPHHPWLGSRATKHSLCSILPCSLSSVCLLCMLRLMRLVNGTMH